VAAVCYRLRKSEIEFLLVRTRGSGRWTFPKGSAEPGLTHAQAAALEAFEEAGVHGRIEEVAFARYFRKRRRDALASTAKKKFAVHAHLCEVLRLSPPKERNRSRTWFAVEEARRHLREGRETEDGAEFARVVDQAAARILRSGTTSIITDARPHERPPSAPDRDELYRDERYKDPLRKVRFEALYEAGIAPYVARLMRRPIGATPRPVVAAPRRKLLECEILPFNARWKRIKALGTGAKS
jgi:8-oxo-dGTP pyrophosphatase MutT (NUDIX family)